MHERGKLRAGAIDQAIHHRDHEAGERGRGALHDDDRRHHDIEAPGEGDGAAIAQHIANDPGALRTARPGAAIDKGEAPDGGREERHQQRLELLMQFGIVLREALLLGLDASLPGGIVDGDGAGIVDEAHAVALTVAHLVAHAARLQHQPLAGMGKGAAEAEAHGGPCDHKNADQGAADRKGIGIIEINPAPELPNYQPGCDGIDQPFEGVTRCIPQQVIESRKPIWPSIEAGASDLAPAKRPARILQARQRAAAGDDGRPMRQEQVQIEIRPRQLDQLRQVNRVKVVHDGSLSATTAT